MRVMQALMYVLLAVCLCGLSACGGGGSHSGGATGSPSTVTAGVVADPYIVGATFFEDTNDNGRRDDGEQLSTPSDENGLFSFSAPVAVGSTLIMSNPGSHQGLPFTLLLRRVVSSDDADRVVVSPLTTLLAAEQAEEAPSAPLAASLTAVDLMTLLRDAGLPWIDDLQEDDLLADPMAGLEGLSAGDVTDADLALLRTNFVAYALLEFINKYATDEVNGESIDRALSTAGFTQLIFDTMELICSVSMLEEAGAGLPAGAPAMAVADLAETIPAILYWWTGHFYSDLVAGIEDFPLIGDVEDELRGFVLSLAPYVYAVNRLGDDAVNPEEFLDPELLPLASDSYFMLANNENPTVRPVDLEIVLSAAAFEDVSYVLADEILHFHADATWETFSTEEDAVERSGGSWSISGNSLIVHDDEENFDYSLTLVAEWPTFLRFMTTDPVMDGRQSGVTNIPLAKVYSIDSEDFTGKTFVVDPDDCRFDSDFCGGRVVFGAYDGLSGEGEATLHIYDADSTDPVTASWSLADNSVLMVETVEETNEVYFYGDDKAGQAVIVTKNAAGAVTDVVPENIVPAKTSDTIPTGVFAVSSLSSGEELVLNDDNTFSWTDGPEFMSGTWSYDSVSGGLTLSSGGDVVVRLWFYGPDDADEHRFYYEDYEGAVPVESGFDDLIPVAG